LEGNLGRMQRFVVRMWGEVKSPLYRNAIFLMLTSIIASGLGFLFWLVVYRVYPSVSDRDLAVTLLNTITFLATIATLGFPIGLIRFLPETEDKTDLINTTLTIGGAAAAILTLIFVAGVGLWAPALGFVLERPEYLIILILTAMAYAFGPLLDQVAVAMRRSDLFTWRVVVFSLLKIPLPIVFVTFFFASLGGKMGIYLSFGLAFGVSVILTGYVFIPRIVKGYRPKPRLSRRRLRPMFAFSVGNWLAGVVASAATLLLPLLILNTLGNPSLEPDPAEGLVSVYYVATLLAGILYIIPQATMTSFFAEASQRNAQRRRDERKAVLLSLGLLAPGIVGLWILAAPLLDLFDLGRYQDIGATPVRILSLAAIPLFLNSVLGTRVRVRKRVQPLIVSAAIATAVTLGLGYSLLRWMQLDGLAIAVALGQVATLPYLYAVAGAPMEVEPIEPTPSPP